MRAALLLAVLFVLRPGRADAADVLFVSDSTTDSNIADALRADGHTVTVATNDYDFFSLANRSLAGDLSAYDCVVWSATGGGFGGIHNTATFDNLRAYVDSGGRVFVTGLGSIGYSDMNLVNFLGGTSGSGYTGFPGVVAAEDTSLTVGATDLRGVMPQAYEFQYEGLVGLTSDTVALVMGVGAFGPPAAQWTLRSYGSGEIAYVANGNGSFSSPSWTTVATGPAGAYNAALRNFVAAADGSAGEPGAPRVRLLGGFSAREGTAVTLDVEVVDEEGDAYTLSWDLDGDGTFGEMAGATSVVVMAGDGPGSITVGCEAIDAPGHVTQRTRRIRVENVSPALTSTPPTVASIAQNLQYHVEAVDPAAAADTLTYELVRGPSSASMVGNVFRFVPTEGDVTPEGVAIDCEVAVTDEDGGRTTQAWRMEVANNYAPLDLVLEFPKNDVALLDRTPRLAVRDGSDLDGDTLTYFFEVDIVDTFDSPRLVASGAVAEEPGFTTFQLTEPLEDGHYYWRAWLSDGEATTEPQVTTFWVVTPMGERPDAGSDAAVVDAGGAGPTDRGCACGIAARPDRAPISVLLIGLVLGILRSRRR
jgi:hypothetical protein